MTHIYAILNVSPACFLEVKNLLEAADYQHAFHGDRIDMHGIALRAKDGLDSDPQTLAGCRDELANMTMAFMKAKHQVILLETKIEQLKDNT